MVTQPAQNWRSSLEAQLWGVTSTSTVPAWMEDLSALAGSLRSCCRRSRCRGRGLLRHSTTHRSHLTVGRSVLVFTFVSVALTLMMYATLHYICITTNTCSSKDFDTISKTSFTRTCITGYGPHFTLIATSTLLVFFRDISLSTRKDSLLQQFIRTTTRHGDISNGTRDSCGRNRRSTRGHGRRVAHRPRCHGLDQPAHTSRSAPQPCGRLPASMDSQPSRPSDADTPGNTLETIEHAGTCPASSQARSGAQLHVGW